MTLAEAHILAQQQLREASAQGVGAAWDQLPAYDEENVDEWLSAVLPIVLAAQHRSAAYTDAFIAYETGRRPLGITRRLVTGAAARLGAVPAEVYRRPFVTVWSGLKNGKTWAESVAEGRRRAAAAAETDVQLTMRETLREVGDHDPNVVGFRRVPDSNACKFCVTVAGQRYRTDELMPIHTHCGCGVDVITRANRSDFTGQPDNDLSGVVVADHGELGPVLVDAEHHFTTL